MIRHDAITLALILIATVSDVYLATFDTSSSVVIFPTILLCVGLVLEYRYRLSPGNETFKVTETAKNRLIQYTIIGVVGLFATGLVVPYIKFPSFALNSYETKVAYGQLMAVSETIFFQGVLLDFALTYTSKLAGTHSSSENFEIKNVVSGFRGLRARRVMYNPYIICLYIAVVITWLHSAVYSNSFSDSLYILTGFYILNVITYKSRTLAPAMVAHCINNLAATI